VTFYSDMAATAVELLEEFGQAVIVTRVEEGEYDPSDGTGTSTSTPYPGMGVALDYRQDQIDGTLIRQGDRRIYIAPDLGMVPKTGDTVTLAEGAVLNVVASRPLSPAGTVLLHDVQVRGVL
jgi:hypothetical protein